MSKMIQQVLMAGAVIALFGATACTSLETSTGYGDDSVAAQPAHNDILQRMAADSQGA